MDKKQEHIEEPISVTDVENIKWQDSKYYPTARMAEHKLECMIHGIPNVLTYEISHHDDGEGFVIHSEGEDIWDLMPESELRKLEELLSGTVEYGHWRRDLEQADTLEAVREVWYSLFETENLELTREQIVDLHTAIDSKEMSLLKTVRAKSEKKSALKELEKNKTRTKNKKHNSLHSGEETEIR